MPTASPTSPQVLEAYALLQIAAEAFLNRTDPLDAAKPPTGSDPFVLTVEMLTNGNRHSSRMTSAQADKFTGEWTVVSHQANTATGFSGTLFRCLKDDPERGMKAGQLVMSFRSTEFVEDAVRDKQATNVLEIRKTGWALGQIADMEAWYQNLDLRPDEVVDVTGYSLGGHLATAFYEMHAGRIGHVFTFNGAGVGRVTSGHLSSVVSECSARRQLHANAGLFSDPLVQQRYQSLASSFSATGQVDTASTLAARSELSRLKQANSRPGPIDPLSIDPLPH